MTNKQLQEKRIFESIKKFLELDILEFFEVYKDEYHVDDICDSRKLINYLQACPSTIYFPYYPNEIKECLSYWNVKYNEDNYTEKFYITIAEHLIKLMKITNKQPNINDMKEILKRCTVENNVIKLPDVELDRKEYTKIKNMFSDVDCKWKGGKIQGFISTKHKDLNKVFDILLKGDESKKNLQFFETPNIVVKQMLEKIMINDKMRVLEPSAGQGAIIKELNNLNITPDCYEFSELNRDVLNDSNLNFNLLGNDFLDASEKIKYDLIIANPPFSKNQDIKHFYKMFDLLKEHGTICCVMSQHWKESSNKKETTFREFLKDNNANITYFNNEEFKESGTKISTCLVVLNR